MTKKKKARSERAGRPGRRPALNAGHVAVLRAITQEQPRSSLDEVTRELLRRTGTKVSTVTVRKALREVGIERLKPVRTPGPRAAVQGSAPRDEHRPHRCRMGSGG
jgi:transposase